MAKRYKKVARTLASWLAPALLAGVAAISAAKADEPGLTDKTIKIGMFAPAFRAERRLWLRRRERREDVL